MNTYSPFRRVTESLLHDVPIANFSGVSVPVKTWTHPAAGEVQEVSGADVSMYRNLDLGNTGQVVKASPGRLFNWEIFNSDVVDIYVKVYDKATAASAADTPKFTWKIPPAMADGFLGEVVNPKLFASGISVRCTTGLADADTTSPATNGCVINLGYV